MKALYKKHILLWLGLTVSLFLVTPTIALAYPAISSADNTYEYITNVTFNDINNTTIGDAGGYGDYYTTPTGTTTTTVAPGSTYPLTVTIVPDTGDKISAFFDWNQDGIVDAGEEVVMTPTIIQTIETTYSVTVAVNIPANATLGDIRMRVVLSGFLLDSDPVQSSGILTYGEAEDYRITIDNGSTGPIITATTGDINGTITPAGAVDIVSGANQSFTIAPNTGFFIDDVLVDGISVGAVTSYDFTNVVANHTIHAIFSSTLSHTITATAGLNGNITPAGAVRVNDGGSKTFSILAASGYQVADVLVDGGSVGAVSSHTLTNITADHTIAASFSADGYPLISSTDFSTEWITNVTFGTINNSSNAEGYGSFLDLSTEVQQGGAYPIAITVLAQADENISVFIDWNQDNIFDPGEETVVATRSPAAGPHLATITVPIDATLGTTRMRVVLRYFESAVSSGDIATNDSGGEAEDYTITIAPAVPAIIASAGANGTIAPPGTTLPVSGANLDVTITADADFFIKDVLVDGVTVGGSFASPFTFSFTNVIVTHTIHAEFLDKAVYTITATSGPNGTISPSGVTEVVEGNSQVFTITPNAGYVVKDVVVDSGSVGTAASYTFPNVTAPHSITATFAPEPPPPFSWAMFLPAIIKNRGP
ncbi:MAG: hypothetical protein KKI15_08545 [Proteobacteria bacterium]|nr:hypothetical protein [Pseudomonadota bacterium]